MFLLLSQEQNKSLFITLLIVFFLPTQLGYHFWPSFSIVSGLRVDYLSPTLYLTDILLLSLFFIHFFFSRKKQSFSLTTLLFSSLPSSLFFLYLGFTTLASYSSVVSSLFLLRVLAICYFSYSLSRVLRSGVASQLFILAVAASVFLQTSFVFLQYLYQGSVGSIGYLFGERTFSVLTPGIASVIVNGEKLLRPYGTFSHPNVLGGYAVIVFFLLLAYLLVDKKSKQWVRLVVATAICACIVLLLFSMSRLAIIAWFVGLALLLLQKKRYSSPYILIGICSIAIMVALFPPLSMRFQTLFTDESVISRVSQITLAQDMLKRYWLFGSGLRTYILLIPEFYTGIITPSILQPVHNVFLLLLVEFGSIGIIFILIGIIRMWRYVHVIEQKKRFPYSLFVMLLFLLSTADHYLLTSQQGLLLLGVVAGVLFSLSTKKA